MIESIRERTTEALQRLRLQAASHPVPEYNATANKILYLLIKTSDRVDQLYELNALEEKMNKAIDLLNQSLQQADTFFELEAARLEMEDYE